MPSIHKITHLTDQPAVYVGTYAKYNNGDLSGAWLDVGAYHDGAEFMAACAALHADEQDPEIMFQDYQGFPREYYGESWIQPELWGWLHMDEEDREILEAYHQGIDVNASLQDARNLFMGKYDSKRDWADQYLDDCGLLDRIPDDLRIYFDVELWARDQEWSGFVSFVNHGGDVFVFSN